MVAFITTSLSWGMDKIILNKWSQFPTDANIYMMILPEMRKYSTRRSVYKDKVQLILLYSVEICLQWRINYLCYFSRLMYTVGCTELAIWSSVYSNAVFYKEQ
jgi:hypothetical protein